MTNLPYSARAMFEKMGSADDLDSISSSNGNNRGSRASSVQRSRSTSPFNTVKSVQPPRSPETPETVSFAGYLAHNFELIWNYYRLEWRGLHQPALVLPMVQRPQKLKMATVSGIMCPPITVTITVMLVITLRNLQTPASSRLVQCHTSKK